MSGLVYKGYEIEPAPYQLADGRWALRVVLKKQNSNATEGREFTAKNTFESRRIAEKLCLSYGQQLVDEQAVHV